MMRIEPLNGGLVQSRHPSTLAEGELQKAVDAVLRPGDRAIHKAPGRTAYGTVASTAITCQKNGTTLLVSTNGFGTNTANVSTNDGEFTISHGSGFGGAPLAGKTVVGTGILPGTFIRRVVTGLILELTKAVEATGTITVTIGSIHPGTEVRGTGIVAGTKIASITDEDNAVMDTAATDSDSDSLTFTETVLGLQYVPFDGNFQDILLAKAADVIYRSDYSGATGTWASFITGTSHNEKANLELISMNENRHTLLTGFDEPRVLYYASAVNDEREVELQHRALGMLPVQSSAFIGPEILTTGAWSPIETMAEGWYYFLITEVTLLDDGTEVESTFSGDPKGVEITDHTAQGILLTYTEAANDPVNDGNYGRNTATHWRVYMARNGPAQELPIPSLAAFSWMTDVSIEDNSVELNEDAAFQVGYPDTSSVFEDGAGLGPDWPLFDQGNALDVLAQQAASTVACTQLTEGETSLSSANAFTFIKEGMTITSENDNLAYGTIVTRVVDNSNININKPTLAAIDTETLFFGNQPHNAAVARTGGSTDFHARGNLYDDCGIQVQGGLSNATISGIKVEIFGGYTGSVDRDPGLTVFLSKNGTASVAESKSFDRARGGIGSDLVVASDPDRLVFGGPGVLWGLSWVPDDLTDANNFGFVVRKNSSPEGSNNDDSSHWIQGYKITVYGGIGNLNLNAEVFETIIISDGFGTTYAHPARGKPPTATTGDYFEGKLVLNDKANPSSITFSKTDDADAFPDVYRIFFESHQRDDVTAIRRLKNVLIVGCSTSIKRLNYLPDEYATEFNRGKAWETISTDHGMVSSRACVHLDVPGRGVSIAYLSHKGLHFTDGITTDFLNEDLDWPNLIDPDFVDRSILVVYPHMSILALYYTPTGETENTAAMYFSYHPIHVKAGGRLPATGPITVKCAAVDASFLAGRTHLLTGHGTDGVVYLEDSGTTDASGADIDPDIQTRQIFLGALGLGGAGRLSRVLLMVDLDGTTTTGGITGKISTQKQGELSTLRKTISTKNTAVGGIIEFFPNQNAALFDFSLSKAGATQTADLRVHYWAYEIRDYGVDTT